MNSQISVNEFSEELNCLFKEERYSVRDNGAVLRHPRQGIRPRKWDNYWTFGELNKEKNYLGIASVRVHSIVATAFHGEAPSNQHVVDHIDTNRRNNRPGNLRWITKLENVLLNPITAKRIAIVCGSVEAFLADPPRFRNQFQDPNYDWMCHVTPEEAQISLERLLAWAKSDKYPSGGTLGAWIFDRSISAFADPLQVPAYSDAIQSKTDNALQRNWQTISEFPCCPNEFDGDPMSSYAANLKVGSLFCSNEIYFALALKFAFSGDRKTIVVLTESADPKTAIKPWAMTKISFENDSFVHSSLGSFFTELGAEKHYTLEQGLEWLGGDTVDVYC